MAHLLSRENEHELCLFGRLLGNIIRGPIRSENDRHFCMRDERITRNPFQNVPHKCCKRMKAVVLSSPVSTVYARNAWDRDATFALFTAIRSRNAPMASFLHRNINLRTPGRFWMLFTRCSDEVSP